MFQPWMDITYGMNSDRILNDAQALNKRPDQLCIHPPCDEYYKKLEQQLMDYRILTQTILTTFGRMAIDDFKRFQENYKACQVIDKHTLEQIRQDSKGSDEQGNSNREKGSGEGNEVVNCGEGDPNC